MLESASTETLGPSAFISAQGGAVGGLSTQRDPYGLSNGAHSGEGYVAFKASNLNIDPGASIAAAVVPVPLAGVLHGSGFIALLGPRTTAGRGE